MTINPFQNLVINTITAALDEGGWLDSQLYFEQLTPLAILSTTAEETGQTIDEVQKDINENAENPEAVDDSTDNISQMSSEDDLNFIRVNGTGNAFFEREYK